MKTGFSGGRPGFVGTCNQDTKDSPGGEQGVNKNDAGNTRDDPPLRHLNPLGIVLWVQLDIPDIQHPHSLITM
jgi:hypothetical protein